MFSFILSETGLIWWFRNFSFDFHFLAFFLTINCPNKLMTHYESLFESINISAPRLANQIRGFGFYSKRKIHSFCNKRTKKEAMREITLSSLAATKMMLHCYKYPHLRKFKNIHFLIPGARPVLNLKILG